MKVTRERLHELFSYKDGKLIRKIRVRHNAPAGDEVGCDNGKGYLTVSVNNRRDYVHRIIYFMHHGWLPEIIDHIDRDKRNNRIENLRCCLKRENYYNAKISKRNTSGTKGVSFNRFRLKWVAQIMVNYKVIMELYKTRGEAEVAIKILREKHHGEFACHI